MRNLAEVVSIKSVETIIYKDKVYDKVCKYTLNENAYEFVGQKGFNVGDKVIFIGEGALIPSSNTNFEFLRTKCYNQKLDMFRIKPQKMCGIISMGILMPMSIVNDNYDIGKDLTDILNLKKFEDLEDASPNKNDNNQKCLKLKKIIFRYLPFLANILYKKCQGSQYPTWLISKTDETNIENCTSVLKQFEDKPTYITIKMEGQSGTFLLDKRSYYVCSRNICYTKYTNNNYWNISKQYNIEKILRDYYKKNKVHLAIQGEICGNGIQNNIYNINGLDLFVFNVKDIDNDRYFNLVEIKKFCSDYGLKTVPIIAEFATLSDFVTTDTLNNVADIYIEKIGFSPKTNTKDIIYYIDKDNLPKIDNKNVFHNEGIVVRGFNQEFSFKFKSKEYALWFSGKE